MNKLVNEKSPYLLQHSTNPVDWQPWSEAAFEEARLKDRPVFLSIGYSTCHWCHVMERESFCDEEVAKILNDAFVCIKVDREERPDIDAVYMHACHILNGSGGWPLSIFMTADKMPFFTGTYYPKKAAYGKPGIVDIALRIKYLWLNNRSQIELAADEITSKISFEPPTAKTSKITSGLYEQVYNYLTSSYDCENGGFLPAPKFPSTYLLQFLMKNADLPGFDDALEMSLFTLAKMRLGGIFDQLGGGFHRYSTDEKWLVPHFEKMLYDQAVLSECYCEAYRLTGDELYRETAGSTLDYVVREMTSPDSGFYSAEDADSNGVEGEYYVWSADEIRHVIDVLTFDESAYDILSFDKSTLFIDLFNVKENGNYSDHFSGQEQKNDGRNILHLSDDLNAVVLKSGLSTKYISEFMIKCKTELLKKRGLRIRPHRDDKVLTDWNSLMITTFARAGRIFHNDSYLRVAEKACGFILANLQNGSGRLFHRWHSGDSAINGYLDDYAFFVRSLLGLHRSTLDLKYLAFAADFCDSMMELFFDASNGGFFFSSEENEKLIVNKKDAMDSAYLSGNSAALECLIQLWLLTANEKYKLAAEHTVDYFSAGIVEYPMRYTSFLSAAKLMAGNTVDVVLTGSLSDVDTMNMIDSINNYHVDSFLLLNRENYELASKYVVNAKDYREILDDRSAIVCRNRSCSLPLKNLQDIENELKVSQPS